ncbi:MAG TPA: hopanoid-associated sugar epimerase [Bryobacteraceae bacterium]|nr:hopanoid-associated sugar epimerase [Bryobacteraceae bacterium]
MKRTFVTGATGFLGWHVARKLLDRGVPVRVLAREPGRVRELDGAEVVRGDLRDPASLEAAVAGCEVVYHVAADYRLWAKDSQGMYRSNVDGTRNLLEAARKARVERFVYTSTVGCVGVPAEGIGDEQQPVSEQEMTGAYKHSKLLAERVALEFAATSLPVVVVNPTAPIGDHDWKPTPTGRIVLDYLQGRMPAYLDTGLNVVDAGDTAEGHLLACERGRSGERYILGSENLTLQQIFERLEAISGVPAPKVRIPYGVAYAAGLVSTAWASLTGQEPRAPIDAVRMARKKMWVSHDKATRELGFEPGPAEGALRRAVEWFRSNGYV